MISPLFGSISPLRVPTKAPRVVSSDADANTYLLAVEAADGQELESGVITAVEDFVLGCKSDGIWSAIKASCILAGARTLSGALVPLVGTAPTNENFVSADYNRETGLKGDLTKKLIANRLNNADPQNSKHCAVFIGNLHTSPPTVQYLLMSGNGGAANIGFTFYVGHRLTSPNGSGAYQQVAATTGFLGTSRSNSVNYDWRNRVSSGNNANSSRTPSSSETYVFGRAASTDYTTTRMSFYSIGEHLALAALDTRVSTLMTDLAAAI